MSAPKKQPNPERALQGRIGGLISWGNTTDRTARTAPARAGFDQRFLDQADGDPVRAEAYRKAYFADLALKSARARRKAKEHTAAADAAEAELRDLGGGSDAA